MSIKTKTVNNYRPFSYCNCCQTGIYLTVPSFVKIRKMIHARCGCHYPEMTVISGKSKSNLTIDRRGFSEGATQLQLISSSMTNSTTLMSGRPLYQHDAFIIALLKQPCRQHFSALKNQINGYASLAYRKLSTGKKNILAPYLV